MHFCQSSHEPLSRWLCVFVCVELILLIGEYIPFVSRNYILIAWSVGVSARLVPIRAHSERIDGWSRSCDYGPGTGLCNLVLWDFVGFDKVAKLGVSPLQLRWRRYLPGFFCTLPLALLSSPKMRSHEPNCSKWNGFCGDLNMCLLQVWWQLHTLEENHSLPYLF